MGRREEGEEGKSSISRHLTVNRTLSHKPVAAESQLLMIFQNSGHTLAQAPDPSLALVQVSYWLNMHRRLRLRRHDSGA